MARHWSSLALCLLALTLIIAHAQESLAPFPSAQHRHRHQRHRSHHHHHHNHKHQHHSVEEKRKLTSGTFNLNQFIADKIAEVVKEVEQANFTYLEDQSRQATNRKTGRQIVGEVVPTKEMAQDGPFPKSEQQAPLDDANTRSDLQTEAQSAARSNHDDRDEHGVESLKILSTKSDSEDQLPEGLVTSREGLITSDAVRQKTDNKPAQEERPQSTEKPKHYDNPHETKEEKPKEKDQRLKSESTEKTKAIPSPKDRPASKPTTTNSTESSRPQSPSHKDDALHQTEELEQANYGKQSRGQDKENKTQTKLKDGGRRGLKSQTSERPAQRTKTAPVPSKQRAEDHWKREKKIRPPKKGCPGCSKRALSISRARDLHKQVLKAQLLDKLRLVPTFTKLPWPPKLPDQVFPAPPQRDHDGYDDKYYAKPDRLLVFGRDLGPRQRLRKSGTGSYQFAVTGKVKGRVTSADLWVYKMKDAHDVHGQTLVITDLRFSKRRRLRERSLVARIDTHVREGWVRFDVTRLVHRWLKEKTPPAEQMLAVRCKTCHRTEYRAIFGAKSNFRPVLVMQERVDVTQDSHRERREACDPSVRCCKFDMTVHFRDLGIYEIFHPRSLKVDYCFGTCERPDAFHYNHTVLIQRQRFGSYEPVNKTMFDKLRPCCVPVVLREASLMYYINDGLDTQVSTVPNLLVERCGCA